ncbi:restriction endonuclease subunit S [Bacillus toyonensis]|uniref:restriction endonuclease subunit S n=1 Tax=Bacillus toyonensis TaxID=155322 RepID=UPI000279564E|nr:restriction endonuclease subunit S [Bacillus toyonensis]EJQ77946.1 hypothetical protein IGO_05616 [Bacillus toyonensis]
MENNHTPEIRFPGYIGDWEERKIGEFLTESRISGTNGLEAKKLTVKLWGKGVVPKDEIYQGSEATKYYIRKAGQFIYGKLDFLHQAFGIIPDKLVGYESTVDSPAFDIADNLNSSFFLEYVSRKQFYLYQGTIANGSRKAKRIHSETFFEMPLIVPRMEEQIKIGNFFKQLDDTIALHQQELDALKQTKQGFLQKMFPKEGKSVPEVRFPGFTGDWEQRNLGDCISYIKGFAFKSEDYRSDGIRLVRVSDLSSNEIKFDNEKIFLDREYENDYKKYKLNVGDIIITTVGSKVELKESAVGRPIIVNKENEGLLNQNLVKISPLNGYNSYFIYKNLLQERYMNYIGSIERGNANQANIAISDLWLYKVYLTSNEEQKQIGNFFKQLDDTIALHHRELDALKETKKAFLQKMFV